MITLHHLEILIIVCSVFLSIVVGGGIKDLINETSDNHMKARGYVMLTLLYGVIALLNGVFFFMKE